jgi:acyl-CoA synthetase (AMP-forming)/AMP-acid ligase II
MLHALASDSYLDAPNLVELLDRRADLHPDRLAFQFDRGGAKGAVRQTYRELQQSAARAAGSLAKELDPGERAIIACHPGLDFLVAFFACLRAGIIAVPAPAPRNDDALEQLRAIAGDCGARAVLTDGVRGARTLRLDRVAKPLFVDELAAAEAPSEDTHPVAADDVALLQYTSGSAGRPKGVVVRHANLIHNSAAIRTFFGHRGYGFGVIWLPPYHDMGLVGGLLQTVFIGGSTVLLSPISFLMRPVRWLEAITRYRANTSGAPDFAYQLCVERITEEQKRTLELGSWHVAFTGGEPVRARTLQRFSEAFAGCGFRPEAFQPCYGMAESTLLATGSKLRARPIVAEVDADALERHDVRPPSAGARALRVVGCGAAAIDQTVAIVDPERCTRAEPSRVGEIWVSGPGVAGGYWNRDELSRETFGAAIAGEGGRYLRTGDLGFVAEGELFITGRLRDLIVIRGRNHYPSDVEETLCAAHPSFAGRRAAAFSVDRGAGEELVCVQEVNEGSPLDWDELAADLREQVVKRHGIVPAEVVLSPSGSLPVTSSGKVRRGALRESYLAGTIARVVAADRP